MNKCIFFYLIMHYFFRISMKAHSFGLEICIRKNTVVYLVFCLTNGSRPRLIRSVILCL
ncbi:predicted protein [Enterococcus faecalis ATCC 4200]|nr:predicted protein [Enterococcus faecalis ATCC 4200]